MSKHKTKSEALSRSGFIGLTARPPRSLNEVELSNPLVLATIAYVQNQFGSPVFNQSVLELTDSGGSVACQTSARTAIDQTRWNLDSHIVWQWAHEAMWAHASGSSNWTQTLEQTAMASPSLDLPPDWNGRRRAVLDRDGHRCAICGWSLKKHGDVHHIAHRSRGGSHHWSNLVSLCPWCHRVLEGHKGMNRPGFRVDDRRRIQQAPKVMKHLRREHPPSPEIIRQARMLAPDICVYRLKEPQGRKKIKKSNPEIVGCATFQTGQNTVTRLDDPVAYRAL